MENERRTQVIAVGNQKGGVGKTTNTVHLAAALGEMEGHDAILLGAIGDPRLPVGMLERAIISGIRFGLDHARLRAPGLRPADLVPATLR